MELLAPAGSYEAFIASINAGADAIYLGGKLFSARAYSSNFTNQEIKELIKYAHIRDVKVYIALNTLIFEDEFFDAVEFARFLYENDVDGLIIQDLGLAYYLHKTMPDLVLHASTQLNCHNIAQAKGLMELGFKRIVLAREVSLKEAEEIKKLGVEIELFVHGALCISYSGNCLMSSFIGGRSGNRGKCAQPCRHHVELVDGKDSSKEYSLSTKDLMTLDRINEYKKIGVDSLKIEGRMKREEYVYQVVSSYRKAIDEIDFNFKEEVDRIKKIFNRDFTKGYVFEESRTTLLNQKTPSNLGVSLGKIVKVQNNFVYLKLEDDVRVGDGINFLNENLDGMLLTRFSINRDFVKEAKKGQIISFSRNNLNLKVGTIVNKTTDSRLNEEINQKIRNNKKIPLFIKLKGSIDFPLVVELSDNLGNEVVYQSDFKLERAKANPTTRERIIAQMEKFDEYPYSYQEVNYQIDEGVFVPISSLNRLRREVLELINKKREIINHYLNQNIPYQCNLKEVKTNYIFAKVETIEQIKEIDTSLLELCTYQEINEPSKFKFLKRIDHQDDRLLNPNEITSYFKNCSKEGLNIYSYYGNVTNSYTLDLLFSKGYQLVFASLECSKYQIKLMVESFYKRHGFYPNLGLHIYGFIDYMIMKSCPIANNFDMKNDHCQLCKKNRYYLKDHLQVKFPIVTDSNCTTRVLANRPICLFSKIDELKELNIYNFMLDFTIEDKDDVRKVMESFKGKTSISNKDFFGHYINQIE